jgi:hypothetical protein
LARAKVPPEWVGIELLPLIQRGIVSQVHVRLVLRQWDDRLVQSMVDLERAFVRRMKLLDGTSTEWVRDVTWRLALQVTSDEDSEQKVGRKPSAPAVQVPRAKSEANSWDDLLDPEREVPSRGADGHADFSPTQPML